MDDNLSPEDIQESLRVRVDSIAPPYFFGTGSREALSEVDAKEERSLQTLLTAMLMIVALTIGFGIGALVFRGCTHTVDDLEEFPYVETSGPLSI